MDVEWVPQRSMDHVPNIPQIAALFIDASRGHHEPDPGIRQEHQDRPDHVEHDRHAHVDPLEQALLHLVPAIIIDVNRAALRHEHQGVHMHDRAEDAGQITEEGGIESEEGEDQDSTQDRRQRVGGQADLDEVVGELIILFCHRPVLRHDPHELDDHAEDRDGQDKASIIEVLLVGEPEKDAAFKIVAWIKLGIVRSLRSRSPRNDPLSLVIDITPLLHLWASVFSCRCVSGLRHIGWRPSGSRRPSATGKSRKRHDNRQEKEANHHTQGHDRPQLLFG